MGDIKKFDLSDGTYFRYRVLGKGKPLMLFHTIRNITIESREENVLKGVLCYEKKKIICLTII